MWRPTKLAFWLPLLLTTATVACGEDDGASPADDSSQPIHVHGLGTNPEDDALFIATHSGLFRSAPDSTSAEPVGPPQDTMGFTVVGPDRFLASGHPPPGESAPPHLGLIESSDAGQSWEPVSLQGDADFHVLRFAHERVYAYDGLSGRLMLSDDGGASWTERRPPGSVFDLAVDPSDAERFIAATERGLLETDDDGESWRPLARAVGLLAWPAPRELYLVDANGAASVSHDGGDRWRPRGELGGLPVAFTGAGGGPLYGALEDGSVLESTNGGVSWGLRFEP